MMNKKHLPDFLRYRTWPFGELGAEVIFETPSAPSAINTGPNGIVAGNEAAADHVFGFIYWFNG